MDEIYVFPTPCAQPGDADMILATQTVCASQSNGQPKYLVPYAQFPNSFNHPGIRQIRGSAYRMLYAYFAGRFPGMNFELMPGRFDILPAGEAPKEQQFFYDFAKFPSDTVYYGWVNLDAVAHEFNGVTVPAGALVVFKWGFIPMLQYAKLAAHSIRMNILCRITPEKTPIDSGVDILMRGTQYTPAELAMFTPHPFPRAPTQTATPAKRPADAIAEPPSKKAAVKKRETTEMCIMCTGLRSGEFVEGLGNALGTTMQVFFTSPFMYIPSKTYVGELSDVDYGDRFSLFPFFAGMSVADRKAAVAKSLARGDSLNLTFRNEMLNADDGTEIILYSVGGEKIVDPDKPDLYDDLMDGTRHKISDFYDLIPRGPKSGSLVMHGHYWKLQQIRPIRVTSLIVTLVAGLVKSGDDKVGVAQKADDADLVHRGLQCSLSIPRSGGVTVTVLEIVDARTPFFLVNWANLRKHNATLNISSADFSAIKGQLDWFTPSLHKSLIQKLVRTRCVNVRMGLGHLYPAPAVLFVSFVMLVTSAGSFVPNLRRFVRGAEAAFKRAGVAMAEDSYASLPLLVVTLAAALAAQEHREFVPSEQLVAAVVAGLIAAQGCKDAYDYRAAKTVDLAVSDKLKGARMMPFNLLTTLHSFQTDILLMWSICCNPEKLYPISTRVSPMPVMPIEYCLDQHSLPVIAHFFRPSNRTFADLFASIFKDGTGRNARKEVVAGVPPAIAAAQQLLWISKTSVQIDLKPDVATAVIPYVLDRSWIAGLLGKIPVTVLDEKGEKTECYVFVNPDSGTGFSAIRPATRDRPVALLSDTVKARAIAAAGNLLAAGIRIQSTLLGIAGTVTATERGFFLDKVPWDTYCANAVRVAVVPALNQDVILLGDSKQFGKYCKYVFTHTCSKLAVIPDFLAVLRKILDSVPADVLPRIAMYVRPIKRVIEIYRISRTGAGVYLAVAWQDSYVFQLMIYLCAIAPGVVRVDRSLAFHISDFRVWSVIRSAILDRIFTTAPTPWENVVFNDDRRLLDHQKAAVDKIKSRITNKQRGNLIWITVGLGKTLIVSTIIGWLIREGNDKTNTVHTHMPRFCIYALPPSALESVKRELERGGLPVNVVRHTYASVATTKFLAYSVNLIVHDQLRLGVTSCRLDMSGCLFILDEMHLALNSTLRTSAALELAKLSWNFIGLTGTLIKDSSTTGLIEWVSQVVEFEVTEANLWVAISALVSQHIKLDFPCKRVFEEIEMTEAESDSYLKYVDPRFGGSATTPDFTTAANVCFDVVQRGIIALTLRLLATTERPIFVVARNIAMQTVVANALRQAERPPGKPPLRVFCIGTSSISGSIAFTPTDPKMYDVVITTVLYSAGYTFTQANIMVTAVYFSNQATRDQLDGRIMRVGQTADGVTIYVLHTGLLTRTLGNYELARSFKESMEDLATAPPINPKNLMPT